MSYNITSWKTKKLENFVIPIKSLYEGERKDWYPKQPRIINFETSEVEIECGCDQIIKGLLKDGELLVMNLEMSGEGSGSFRYYVFDNALKQSKGILEAKIIWEGGDSITHLSVNNGVLTEENIEL